MIRLGQFASNRALSGTPKSCPLYPKSFQKQLISDKQKSAQLSGFLHVILLLNNLLSVQKDRLRVYRPAPIPSSCLKHPALTVYTNCKGDVQKGLFLERNCKNFYSYLVLNCNPFRFAGVPLYSEKR